MTYLGKYLLTELNTAKIERKVKDIKNVRNKTTENKRLKKILREISLLTTWPLP